MKINPIRMVSTATGEKRKICVLLILRSAKLGQYKEVIKASQTIFVTHFLSDGCEDWCMCVRERV